MSEKATANAAPEKASHRSHAVKLNGGASPRLALDNPFFGLQQTIGNQAMLRLLDGGIIQTKLRVSQPGDADEQEADWIAEQVVSSRKAPTIQRKCACSGGTPCAKCAGEEEETIHRSVALPPLRFSEASLQRAPAEQSASPAGSAEKAGPHHHGTHPLVVEDDAEKVEPHQMRKSQFIALLRKDACATADAVLMSVGHTTKGCPYVAKWLSFYEKQSSQHIEAAMRKYAPETATARSAHEAIRLLVVRIQKAALSWAKTGKVEGLPPEIASQIAGGKGLLEKVHDFATTGVAGAIFGFIGGKGKKEDDAGSSSVMRKSQTKDPAPAHDAASVRSQLGTGHSLDTRVQSQMSSAFGYDFSGVRVHTDASAAKLSTDLQARAFTIGTDVAFASNEYRPGTLIGDALIAHELAHVVQQSEFRHSDIGRMKIEDHRVDLEEDADRSAVQAVVSPWTRSKAGLTQAARKAYPQLRSGLKLQRCAAPAAPAVIAGGGAVADILAMVFGAAGIAALTQLESDQPKRRTEKDPRPTPHGPPVAPPLPEPRDRPPKECEETARRYSKPDCRITPITEHAGARPGTMRLEDIFCEKQTQDPCEYVIRAGSSENIRAIFDSVHGGVAYECKCGYEEHVRRARRGNSRSQQILDKTIRQILNHAHRVAKDCGFKYRVIASSKVFAEYLRHELGSEVDVIEESFAECD